MDQEYGEMYDGLKMAVHRWNATLTGVIPDLQQDLDLVRDHLQNVSQTLALRYDITVPLLIANAQLDAVQQDDATRRREAEQIAARVNQLNDALGNFEIETHTLAAQAQRARHASHALSAALCSLTGAQLPPDGALEEKRISDERMRPLQRQISELKAQLEEERQRNRALAQHALSPEMQEELYTLRTEVDTLRREQESQDSLGTELNDEQQRRLRAVALEEDGKRRRMGQILVQAGIITEQQLEIALNEQRSSWSRHLGSILVQLGFATEEIIAQTLAAQLRLPFVNVRYEDIDSEILCLVSPNIARLHTCIPLHMASGDLTVAMANPLDIVALDDLRLATGHNIKVCVGAASEIKSSIDRHYSKLARA